jgi:choline dehydrogenase-like flavoprotein
MLRYREEDFGELAFDEGISPAWPFDYAQLAPYYQQAETLYQVRGTEGEDSCEPAGAKGYVGPAVADEAAISGVRARLQKAGVRPFSLPLALDIDRWPLTTFTCRTARAVDRWAIYSCWARSTAPCSRPMPSGCRCLR